MLERERDRRDTIDIIFNRLKVSLLTLPTRFQKSQLLFDEWGGDNNY